MNATNRVKIKPGLHVLILLKKDQRSGKVTEGIEPRWGQVYF
ncbi:MAG: DUF2196 domain-containing protein [Desulfobacterales bacterium]